MGHLISTLNFRDRLYSSHSFHIQAFKELQNILDAMTSDNDDSSSPESIKLDELSLESGKSTQTFAFIKESKTAADTANKKMSDCFLGRPLSYLKDSLATVSKITVADVKRVLKERVQPVLSPTKGAAKIVVTANPSQVDQIFEGFKKMGLDVKKMDVNEIMLDELQ